MPAAAAFCRPMSWRTAWSARRRPRVLDGGPPEMIRGSAGLVDQGLVGLVDYGDVVPALDGLVGRQLHVVAQEVEPSSRTVP